MPVKSRTKRGTDHFDGLAELERGRAVGVVLEEEDFRRLSLDADIGTGGISTGTLKVRLYDAISTAAVSVDGIAIVAG